MSHRPASVGTLDTTPVRPFGFGLSSTTFAHSDPRVDAAEVRTDGALVVRCRVTDTGARAGADVVQLHGSDPVARVELFVGTSCADPVLTASVELTGPVHEVSVADRRTVAVEVVPG